MKKLLLILLAMCVLAGCQIQNDPTGTETPTESSAASIYEPDSLLEQQTGGAVRTYSLAEDDDCIAMASIGNKLLLLSQSGVFTVLDAEKGEVLATANTDCVDTTFDTAVTGVAYYSRSSREVVLLNPQLQENSRYALPEEIDGLPQIDLDNQQIYYCVDQEIRALDMQKKISRLVKRHSCSLQWLDACEFNGTMLICTILDNTGKMATIYLSTQTGQTLNADEALYGLYTYGDLYFALRSDGVVYQRIFGTRDGSPMSLNVEAEDDRLCAALPLNGILTAEPRTNGVRASLYDLTSGKRTAQVEMTGLTNFTVWHADSNCVWVLAEDIQTGRQILCRWDPKRSAVEEEMVYTAPLMTSENPDAQAIAQCQSWADVLADQYGVKILLWEDALTQTGGYTFESEHQVIQLKEFLDETERVLSLFPADFLDATLHAGDIVIHLVRSMDAEVGYVQYWAEGDCHIAVSRQADIAFALLQGIGLAVDSHVLGNSRDFDTWDSLNPRGFSYDYDYSLNSVRKDVEAYLTGESRAFVDQLSMSFPTEDRSRLFAAAMTADNAEVFASDAMQAKLERMSDGIREAYGWEKRDEVFPWEQYLN